MLKVWVKPTKGYVNNDFMVYYEFTSPESNSYVGQVSLNGKYLGYLFGQRQQGIFIKKGEKKTGYYRIRTDKIGNNTVTVEIYKEVAGRFVSHYEKLESVKAEFTATTSETPTECSKESFRNGMVNIYKKSKRLLGWANKYSPIIDVTDLVKQVKSGVVKAKLTIYGNDLSKISVVGPYDKRPPHREVKDRVHGWELGSEYERAYCPANGKYYWVVYPCKLDIQYSNGGGGGGGGNQPPAPPEQPSTGIPTWLIIVLILLVLSFAMKRRYQ